MVARWKKYEWSEEEINSHSQKKEQMEERKKSEEGMTRYLCLWWAQEVAPERELSLTTCLLSSSFLFSFLPFFIHFIWECSKSILGITGDVQVVRKVWSEYLRTQRRPSQLGETWGIRPIHRTIPNSGTSPPLLIQAILSPSESTGASGSS